MPVYDKPERKTYKCPFCGASYFHAQARKHWELCVKRPDRQYVKQPKGT